MCWIFVSRDKNVVVNEIKEEVNEMERFFFDGFFDVGIEFVKVCYISDGENDIFYIFLIKKRFCLNNKKRIFICLFLIYFWING